MTRNVRHEAGVARVSRALTELGIAHRRADRYEADLVLEDGAKVVVHSAKPAMRTKRIEYASLDGTPHRYEYRLRTLHWSLHVHGLPGRRVVDWIICVSATAPDCFVLPGDVAIKTLRVELDRKREYRGRYACYRNAWHLLTSRAAGTSCADLCKSAVASPGGPGDQLSSDDDSGERRAAEAFAVTQGELLAAKTGMPIRDAVRVAAAATRECIEHLRDDGGSS